MRILICEKVLCFVISDRGIGKRINSGGITGGITGGNRGQPFFISNFFLASHSATQTADKSRLATGEQPAAESVSKNHQSEMKSVLLYRQPVNRK